MNAPTRNVEGTAPVELPTPWGTFIAQAWRGHSGEHLSLTAPGTHHEIPRGQGDTGRHTTVAAACLVRVHSECLTGDVFGSHRCDCGEQLDAALSRIAEEGGTVLYLRGHEGRGIGLFNKLRAYHLQDDGADTVDANTLLGLPVDARTYDDAAAILRALGRTRIRLLTNNPHKQQALTALGIEVTDVVPNIITPRPENHRYLSTKRDRMAHHLPA